MAAKPRKKKKPRERRTSESIRLPGPGELLILSTLWENGPSTVRFVYDAISEQTAWGYTTVLKMLQLMHEKGLVIRDTTQIAHTYAAAVPASRTRQALLRDLLSRGFGGSVVQIVTDILRLRKPTADELQDLRRLLASYGR